MSAITHANDRGGVRRALTRATRAVELVTRLYGDRRAGDKEAAENSPLLCMVYSVAVLLSLKVLCIFCHFLNGLNKGH